MAMLARAMLYAVGTQVAERGRGSAGYLKSDLFLLPFAIAAVLLAAAELRRLLRRR